MEYNVLLEGRQHLIDRINDPNYDANGKIAKDKRDKEKALSQLQEVNFRQNIAKVSNKAHVYKQQAEEFSKFKLEVLNSADNFIA